MTMQRDGIRKAAILVASLDAKAAQLVLRQMGPQQAEMVGRTMAELGNVDPGEQRRVIDEFFRVGPMIPEKEPPGIELDGRLAQRPALRPARAPDANGSEETPLPDGPPFGFLREAETEKLTRILAAERPQTIALVLAHLPAAQAGGVLVRLAPNLQVEVVRRLVDLEETAPEVLHEVERGLWSRLAQQVQMQRRRVAGLSAVNGILEASDAHVGGQILDNVAAHDQALAARLTPCRFEFHDLAAVDGPTLRTILAAADPELLVLALTGAAPDLVERVLAQFPPAEVADFRRRLGDFGPTRLSDVEEARRRIAAVASRLVAQDRCPAPHRHEPLLAGIGA
jgi:flagellar motor switch protein FliG